MESHVNDNETKNTNTHTHTHMVLLYISQKYQQTQKKEYSCSRNSASFSVCRNCCGIICTSNEKDDDDPYGTGKDEMMYKTCECFYDMTKFITFYFQVFVIKKEEFSCNQIKKHCINICCMCFGKDIHGICIENMKTEIRE